mmetsp:Transcript_43721/g.106883  ORF Transcript_43721/g.106883 Transcript_43721/m.106883 type:complete len:156 (+) Transcript_43721:205-672(+)
MAAAAGDVLPDEVQAALSSCEESMGALEEVLEPLLSTPWEVLTARLDAMEKAKLNLMMAYAVNSLYFIYLKTQGTKTEEHPITEELARIKTYMAKIKEAAAAGEKEQSRLKLNKDAAARFIKSGLGKSGREKDDQGEDAAAASAGGATKKKRKSG